jgi:hypothetical protein
MSIWYTGMIIATVVWSLLFKIQVFGIFLAICIVYFAYATFYQIQYPNLIDQKIRMSAFDDSGDPTLYASVEIDLTNVDDFLKCYNENRTTEKLTYSHFGVSSIAKSLSALQLGSKMAFGAHSCDNHVDAGLLVDINGSNLSVLLMNDCDRKSIPEICTFFNNKIKLAKSGKIRQINAQNKLMAYFPSYVSKFIMSFGLFIISDLGIHLYPLTPKQSPRIHCAISNISVSNIHHVYTALAAITKLEVIAVLAAPLYKPLVVDGKIEMRRTMTIDLTIDARFINIEQCAILVPKIKEYWEDTSNYSHLIEKFETK